MTSKMGSGLCASECFRSDVGNDFSANQIMCYSGRTSDTVFRREIYSRRQWGYGTCYSGIVSPLRRSVSRVLFLWVSHLRSHSAYSKHIWSTISVSKMTPQELHCQWCWLNFLLQIQINEKCCKLKTSDLYYNQDNHAPLLAKTHTQKYHHFVRHFKDHSTKMVM